MHQQNENQQINRNNQENSNKNPRVQKYNNCSQEFNREFQKQTQLMEK